MKTYFKIFLAITAAVLIRPATAAEQPKNNTPKPLVPAKSVFILPANAKEGRDPFFPESTRTFDAAVAANKTVEISALNIKGFSGTPGHRFVIINNHTFGSGDEGDVRTATGRIHIRCTEIRSDTVIIEVNGQRREMHLGTQ